MQHLRHMIHDNFIFSVSTFLIYYEFTCLFTLICKPISFTVLTDNIYNDW